MTEPIRIANCSGFYGDRIAAAREMVEGGPIDVLTGDWLAELTMLILSRIRARRERGGFARTFVDQMEQVMGTCLDRGIKVVSNAGGINPLGLGRKIRELAGELGLEVTVGVVEGDDIVDRLDELRDLVPSPGVPGVGPANHAGPGAVDRVGASGLGPVPRARECAVAELEPDPEARARDEGEHTRMSDVVEMESVEVRVARRDAGGQRLAFSVRFLGLPDHAGVIAPLARGLVHRVVPYGTPKSRLR